MFEQHHYTLELNWTGNTGTGTATYADYDRSYSIKIGDKPVLYGSSDPSFRGDPAKYNPEDMLLMALSGCHMLWYLHLCAVNKITVEKYQDLAEGTMAMNTDGSGEFTDVTLKPEVTISAGDAKLAKELHSKASEMCFIARSVNFPVHHKPLVSQF